MSVYFFLVCLVVAAQSQGTIFTPIGSANAGNPGDQYVTMVRNAIQNMTARWLRYDQNCDPKACFALMYLHMTVGLRDHIASGYFAEGALMAEFTIKFAGRYFQWLDRDEGAAGTIAAVWQDTFTYARQGSSSVFEDLFLGMNAHINYDLGQIVYEQDYYGTTLKADYDRVNDILSEKMGPITADLARRYDPTLSSTTTGLLAPGILQIMFGWREAAWQNGQVLRLGNFLTRPLQITSMDNAALLAATPYKTYNAAGLFASTLGPRAVTCTNPVYHQIPTCFDGDNADCIHYPE